MRGRFGCEPKAVRRGPSKKEVLTRKMTKFLCSQFQFEMQMMTACIQKIVEVLQSDTCRESTEKDRPVEVLAKISHGRNPHLKIAKICSTIRKEHVTLRKSMAHLRSLPNNKI